MWTATRPGRIPVRWSLLRQKPFETGFASGRRRSSTRLWPNSNCPCRNGPEPRRGASRHELAGVVPGWCRPFRRHRSPATSARPSRCSALRSHPKCPSGGQPQRPRSSRTKPEPQQPSQRPRQVKLRLRPSRLLRNPNPTRRPVYRISRPRIWKNRNRLRSRRRALKLSVPIRIGCPVSPRSPSCRQENHLHQSRLQRSCGRSRQPLPRPTSEVRPPSPRH